LAAEPPAKVVDLSAWMLTLPVARDRAGTPDEIKQPQLKSFIDPDFFFVNDDGTGIVFRAPCGGTTTKNSKFPRSELREMQQFKDEPIRAAWDTDSPGVHTLSLQLAVTRTPPVKKHVTCAQIHDAEDDLMMIRLEGKKLFVERNELEDVMLDRDYQLGDVVDVKIEAGQGRVKVFYKGQQKMDWKVARRGCYFKTGCYTQSNLTKGDAADSYGEVVIYKLAIDHRD
jgi:poly(beta-D-mannuronate) lyase